MSPARPGELRASKAAERLGVHVRTVRRWCIEGRVAFRLDAGGHYWLVRAQVDAIVADPEGWRSGDISNVLSLSANMGTSGT